MGTLSNNAEYLGDSVYVDIAGVFSGPTIVIQTRNGRLPTDPSNVIFLNPQVLKALVGYAVRHGMIEKNFLT